jgi:ATP:cob(I)alamin adenosyltransferase
MSEGNPPVSTRRGDDGTTTLLGAGRLPKNDIRIALLGEVDEASASLGLARAEADDGEIKELLLELQRLLYRIMGDVAMPNEENVVGPEDVDDLGFVLAPGAGDPVRVQVVPDGRSHLLSPAVRRPASPRSVSAG